MNENLNLPGARAGVEADFEKVLEPEPGLKFDRLRNLAKMTLMSNIFKKKTLGEGVMTISGFRANPPPS